MKNMYYQSHTCDGYSAKIIIEWEIPENTHDKCLELPEYIASEILKFSGPKTRDMVNKMRRIK